jgi:hypothetical protein
VFKHRDSKTGELVINNPSVLEKDDNGNPVLIKMYPMIRFVKAGMEPKVAQEASKRWIFLNRIRHKNENNTEALEEFLLSNSTTRKAHLLGTLDFFTRYGLYTRDK